MLKGALRRNIILGALGFAVAFGGIYFYKTQFSEKAKIEKCADYGYTVSNKKNEDLKFVKKQLELKLRNNVYYEASWKRCEDELRNYPELFNAKY